MCMYICVCRKSWFNGEGKYPTGKTTMNISTMNHHYQHVSITAAYPVHLGANDHTERKGSACRYPWSNALLNFYNALLTNKLLS